MSLAVGVDSSSKNMGLDDKDKSNESEVSGETMPKTPPNEENVDEQSGGMSRQMSENSISVTEDEEDDEDRKIELGPQYTLKEQFEKDKDDESLRRWKEQLLGSVDFESVGVPENGRPKGSWFTLKEGSRYSLQFSFQVSNNIVSGLKYTNTVWKTGLKVDSTKMMLGTFSPQAEPYTQELPEDTTPSGFFARGSYSAKSKFVDDDNKCYLEINYTFDIGKEWLQTEV